MGRKRRGERASAPTWRTVTTVAAATRKETPRKKNAGKPGRNARKRRRERHGGRIKHRHGPPLRERFRMNTRRGRLSPTRVGTWRAMTRFIFSIFRGGIEKGRIGQTFVFAGTSIQPSFRQPSFSGHLSDNRFEIRRAYRDGIYCTVELNRCTRNGGAYILTFR